MQRPRPPVLRSSYCGGWTHVRRPRHYCSRRTRPIWLVPRKAPLPKFCNWRTTPLTVIALPLTGLGTVPLNRPEDDVIVKPVVLVVPVALVLVLVKATSLVKLCGRFPLATQAMPVWIFKIGTPFVNLYGEPNALVSLVNPPA